MKYKGTIYKNPINLYKIIFYLQNNCLGLI